MKKDFTIKEICKEAFDNAEKKGWHKKFSVTEKLALIHSEVSEALEDYRNHKMEPYSEETISQDLGSLSNKPCGFPSELADIIIRVADLAKYLKVDLNEALRMKMAYNRTRPYKHGGKKC